MNFRNGFRSISGLMVSVGLALIIFTSCTPGTRLMNKIPIHAVEVQVLDLNDNPITGAQVEASNGRQTTTDEDGMAKIRFGSVGLYSITVVADNRMPNNFVVTMPSDNGKTLTARLTNTITFTGITYGSANLYPLIFNYMFSSYGYGLELDEYRAGDWTRWKVKTDSGEESMTISKAFLKQLDNGKQWWQVVIEDANEEDNSYTAEILFSEDRSSILRYREQIGEHEPQEKPVSDNWYTRPTSLTRESLDGAVNKENIEVTVPKGTFTADLLVFGVAPEQSLNIWKANEQSIPGDVLKYEVRSQDDELMYQNELQDFGSDAKTRLGSF